ncbi:MAG TPA: cation:proton antiporter [Gemmatimonadaceae bacterium]|nr:cation:proton antiporter [Gemmatimonadaceae bacterium]
MDPTTLPPISGHAILLLLLQLAGVLALARTLSEVMRRLRQPAVIGELLAGILLGPTVLGRYLPALEVVFFPPTTRQFHLLEAISWIGMVLLLLLTGLETDIRVMRSLGRAALFASLGGMLTNFTLGGTLGWLLPAHYLVPGGSRAIFAAFLATALAITAMPVVAKILIDLGLVRRNIGVLILSAGVLDDTTGWLVLSVIAGIAAAGGFSITRFGLTLLGLVAYVAAMRWVIYPLFVRLLRYVNERVKLAGADVTLILVFTFLSAAATEAIGIHAVFGAFAMGLLIRQVPRVRDASLHAIETFVLSALSPVFFAFVGLKVNLWALTGWQLPAVVIGVAVVGKLVGCYSGARVGGLSHWESIAVGFGMNARGAMELVVALIGLSLGLLTAEMYSTIVLVAVVTSFMAPLLLRLVMPKLVMTDEERRRVEDDGRSRLLPAGPVRILAPTAGGPNAAAMLAIAAPVVGATGGSLVALYVERVRHRGLLARLMRLSRPSRSLAGRGIEEHLARAAERMNGQGRLFAAKRTTSADPAGAILSEASRDYDLLMLGAAPQHVAESSMTGRILKDAKLPAVVVRAGDGALPAIFCRLLVPLDGSVFSHAAAEFAFAYAGAARAHVTLLHVLNEARVTIGTVALPESHESHPAAAIERSALERSIRAEYDPLAADGNTSYEVRVLVSGDPSGTIVEVAGTGEFDLLVLGAENKLIAQPLFFGQGTASIVDKVECTAAVVVPWVR